MSKWLNICARALTILAIAFISLFALDSFNATLPLCQQILGFLIHLIPSYVLIAILLAGWRWPMVGGALLIFVGCVPFALLRNDAWVNLLLGGPFIIAGALFIAASLTNKTNAQW